MNARFCFAVILIGALGMNAQARGDDPVPAAQAAAKPDSAAVAQWKKQLVEWRKEFFTGADREAQALWDEGRAKIAAIDDPAAVPAIAALLKTEKHPQFRRALIVPLMQLGGKEAVDCLVKWSVEDENPLLREEAAKSLVGREGLDAYLDTYIAYLKSPKFVANAAEALLWSQIGKPKSQSERPNPKLTKALINAVHTVQTKIVPYRVAFDSGLISKVNPSGVVTYGYTRGVDEGWARVKIPVPQEKVVATLKEYTGQDYQYDQSRWRAWESALKSR